MKGRSMIPSLSGVQEGVKSSRGTHLVGSEVCWKYLRGTGLSSLKHWRGGGLVLLCPPVPMPLLYLAETVWANAHLLLQFHWDKHIAKFHKGQRLLFPSWSSLGKKLESRNLYFCSPVKKWDARTIGQFVISTLVKRPNVCYTPDWLVPY